jgi:hypothetical protein
MIYSRSFGALGNARKRVEGDRGQEWLLWCLGSALFANVIASFGINFTFLYLLCFFPLLACILVAVSEAKRPAGVKIEIRDDSDLASVPHLIEA